MKSDVYIFICCKTIKLIGYPGSDILIGRVQLHTPSGYYGRDKIKHWLNLAAESSLEGLRYYQIFVIQQMLKHEHFPYLEQTMNPSPVLI